MADFLSPGSRLAHSAHSVSTDLSKSYESKIFCKENEILNTKIKKKKRKKERKKVRKKKRKMWKERFPSEDVQSRQRSKSRDKF